jgi:hypothetical protein
VQPGGETEMTVEERTRSAEQVEHLVACHVRQP